MKYPEEMKKAIREKDRIAFLIHDQKDRRESARLSPLEEMELKIKPKPTYMVEVFEIIESKMNFDSE